VKLKSITEYESITLEFDFDGCFVIETYG